MSGAVLALDLGAHIGWACGQADAMISGSADPGQPATFVTFMDALHLSAGLCAVTVEVCFAPTNTNADLLSRLPGWCVQRRIAYRGPGAGGHNPASVTPH